MQSNELWEEIERKIGRNVLRFQRIEAGLKFLLIGSDLSGYLDEIKDVCERQTKAVNGRTMGQVATQLLDKIQSDSPVEDITGPEGLKGIWVAFGFRVETDALSRDELRSSLSSLVAERNELVHHFLSKLDFTSAEGASAAMEHLDRQHERAKVTLDWVRSCVETWNAAGEAFAEYFASDLYFLRMSRVVQLLSTIDEEKARPDGWTELAMAGQSIAQETPENMAALREKLGRKTLKELALMTGWFEVHDEPAPKGGVRTLFRRKPE